MQCFHPVELKGGQVVPCGHCIGCRINRTSQWSFRLLCEQKMWKECCFITLTYDDDHLPEDLSLHPEHLQLFWKRLRKYVEKPIKYYACGEYGSRQTEEDYEKLYKRPFGRPHYHAIVFGLGTSDADRRALAKCWTYCNPLKFTDRRTHGCCSVTKDDIQYVAGYCQKKLLGDVGEAFYQECVPPFARSSRGLGLEYFKDNMNLFVTDDLRSIKLWNGNLCALPKYYKDKLELEKSLSCVIDSMKDMAEKLGYNFEELDSIMPRWKLKTMLEREFTYYREDEVKNHLESYYQKQAIRRK